VLLQQAAPRAAAVLPRMIPISSSRQLDWKALPQGLEGCQVVLVQHTHTHHLRHCLPGCSTTGRHQCCSTAGASVETMLTQ